MTTASAVYRDGKVVLSDEVDWSDGVELEVRPKTEQRPKLVQGQAKSGREILEYMDRLLQEHPECFLSEETLNHLSALQENPPVSPSRWEERCGT